MKKFVLPVLLGCAAWMCASAQGTADYCYGADVSWASQMQAIGHKLYNWDGEERDCFALMKELGLEAVRLRVWVDPSAYGNWCSKEDALAMAKKAQANGLQILVNCHYSDWWADPAKQNIPAAWEDHDYEQMKLDVRQHTLDVLRLFKDNGVTPLWFQAGNETSNGMLWSVVRDERGWEVKDADGNTTITKSMGHLERNPKQYAGFIEAAYLAAKEVFPDIKVIVHLDNGFDNDLYNRNLDVLKSNGAHWDMIGMSLYPYWAMTSGRETDADTVVTKCIDNIRKVSEKYDCDVMIVETGFEVDESRPEVIAEGRRLLERAISESRHQTNGRCKGIFYWEPECRPSMYRLGAFTEDGRPTEIMKAFSK